MLFVVSVFFSIVLPIVYYSLFIYYADNPTIADRASPTRGRTLLELEYKVLNEGDLERTNWILLSGTLFITASIFLIGQSVTIAHNPAFKEIFVAGSWSIYSIWLFLFDLADARYAAVTRERLKWIETKSASLRIDAKSYMGHHRVPIRGWVWFILLNALLAIGNALVRNSFFIVVNLLFIILAIITDIVRHRKIPSGNLLAQVPRP